MLLDNHVVRPTSNCLSQVSQQRWLAQHHPAPCPCPKHTQLHQHSQLTICQQHLHLYTHSDGPIAGQGAPSEDLPHSVLLLWHLSRHTAKNEEPPTSKLVKKKGKRVSDVSKCKSLALRIGVNCAQHDIFSKAKQGLVTPHPNTLQAGGDCKHAQIIRASIGSNDSNPFATACPHVLVVALQSQTLLCIQAR